ncbi:MAG: endonuclease III [Deltaproteobacteria bacterium]|nr:endonuclease III [Deltaproteobacteria bacterium]
MKKNVTWRSDRKIRAAVLSDELERLYPVTESELVTANPYQKVVATILSAQCTDKRVNMVTPALFERYPTPVELADADTLELESIIRSTGFYHNKAKNLIGMAKVLTQVHHGEVPSTMEDLLQLPGVARKTANCVLNDCFNIPSGIVVDTHVARLSIRFGLTEGPKSNAVKIENDLMSLFPQAVWISLSHRFIAHGRGLCSAKKPSCAECPLSYLCVEFNTGS